MEIQKKATPRKINKHQALIKPLLVSLLLSLTSPCLAMQFYVGADSGFKKLTMKRHSSGSLEDSLFNINLPVEEITLKKKNNTANMGLDIGIMTNWNHWWQFGAESSMQYSNGSIEEQYQDPNYDLTEHYKIVTQQPWTYSIDALPGIVWQRYLLRGFVKTGYTLSESKTKSLADGGGRYGPSGNSSRWLSGYVLGAGIEKDFKLKSGQLGVRTEWNRNVMQSYSLNTQDPRPSLIDPSQMAGTYLN